VPADPSSPIAAALAPLAHADPFHDREPPHLLACLAGVPDPRVARGRRHPLVGILGLAAAAVLAGARSIAAIAEWAADAPQPVRAALGARRDGPDHCSVPAEATIRRTLARLDADVLASAIGAWLGGQERQREPGRPATRRRAVAVDGKTLRGAKGATADGRPVHLLACMDHASRGAGPTPGRRRTRRGARLRPAAGRARPRRHRGHRRRAADPSRGRRVPGHPQAGPLPVRRQGQPAHPAGPLDPAGWHRVPTGDRTRDRGHGRVEIRTLKAVSVTGFGFPHAAQVAQVIRKTRDLGTRRWQTVTVYAITSLPFQLARPARLADLLRGHWAIEALHHIRDVTFCEDDSQVRTGAAPHVMAVLRNLVIGVLSRAGPVNLAAALRRHARNPRRPLATLGINLG
jgi:predicted transposase YbfD/YdcC